VVLSGNDDEATVLEALEKGAQEYLFKGRVSSQLLRKSVRYALERKRAEAAVHGSERRYHELFTNMSSGVAMYEVVGDGEDFIFKDINPAGTRIGNLSREDVVGRSVLEVYPGVKELGILDVFREVWRTGQSHRHPVSHYRDNRLSLWVENYIYKLPSGEIVAVYDDVTRDREADERLRKMMEGVIHAVAMITESRDPYTAGHQERVSRLAVAIASDLGFEEKDIEGIRIGGLVHDIGKVCVPAEILSKPTRLSEAEFSLIKNHPRVGYETLMKIEFPWPLNRMVLQHHERLDGSGYPRGLKGEAIIMEARILAVADVVEAMVSHRPYRPACGLDKALEEVKRGKGATYDARVVDCCIRLFAESRFSFDS
jgi:putative nucleotidyltransferase with HDIG domain